MSEPPSYHGRYRRRAQSLFEYRPRVNTDLTSALLDRLISSSSSNTPSNETTTPSDECEIVIRNGTQRTIFFILQPLVAGFLVFPLLIIFWQAGWNFMFEWLSTPSAKHWAVLPLLYFLAQLILLFIYLNQDHLYDYLHKKKSELFVSIILQFHTLITASTYIIQWLSMWTIWDRYTSGDWLLMLIVSIAALLGIVALMGHPCDLVCAPFILSYDSIEYNIRIGSPFLTKKMNECLAHFLNYIFYEFIMSLLSILVWRGSYTLLDVYLYPKNDFMSAGFSLLLGYPLYFLLMYTQSYSDKICQLPTFVYLNYPSLIRNIRHLLAFFTCVLLWRGFWLLFDTCITPLSLELKSLYLLYTICMIISFSLLSFMKTASSINGPMSHMFDQYELFPHYPNCYLAKWYNEKKKSGISSSNTSIEPYTISLL